MKKTRSLGEVSPSFAIVLRGLPWSRRATRLGAQAAGSVNLLPHQPVAEHSPHLTGMAFLKMTKIPGSECVFFFFNTNRHFRASMRTTVVPPLQFEAESSAKMRPRAHRGLAAVGLWGIRPIPLGPRKDWNWPWVSGSGMVHTMFRLQPLQGCDLQR